MSLTLEQCIVGTGDVETIIQELEHDTLIQTSRPGREQEAITIFLAQCAITMVGVPKEQDTQGRAFVWIDMTRLTGRGCKCNGEVVVGPLREKTVKYSITAGGSMSYAIEPMGSAASRFVTLRYTNPDYEQQQTELDQAKHFLKAILARL